MTLFLDKVFHVLKKIKFHFQALFQLQCDWYRLRLDEISWEKNCLITFVNARWPMCTHQISFTEKDSNRTSGIICFPSKVEIFY